MRDESAASYAAPAPRQPTRAARRLRYECYGSTVDALAPCTTAVALLRIWTAAIC